MGRFAYRAVTPAGKTVRGRLEATSPRDVRRLLREQNLTPLEIVTASGLLPTTGRRRGARVPTATLSLFSRQLATLINASLPLESALEVIARQTDHPALATVLKTVRSKVVEGHTLADALGDYPRLFDPMFCTLVTAGERTGQLGPVLEKMADYNEIRQQLKSKFTQAMIYPLMLTLVAILVITILLVAVVPQIIEQFVHMKQALPVTTRILISVSSALQTAWLPASVVLLLGIVGGKLMLRHPQHRMRFHHQLLRPAVIGPLIRAINSARYARTLSILQTSGVPLLEAMNIAAAGVTNLRINLLLTQAAESVRQGNALFKALEQTQLFPPMMLYMIASGEQSGRLGELMARAADNQDQLMQQRLAMALSLFEPALIVSMASIVLFIVMAILQPILQLNNLVS